MLLQAQYLLLNLFAIKSSTLYKQLSAIVTIYIITHKKKREIKAFRAVHSLFKQFCEMLVETRKNNITFVSFCFFVFLDGSVFGTMCNISVRVLCIIYLHYNMS